jgi:hypothetical protein
MNYLNYKYVSTEIKRNTSEQSIIESLHDPYVYMADAQQNPLRLGWLCIPGFITWSDTKPEEQSSDVPAVAEYTLGMTHQEKDTPPASMFLQNRCPLVPVSHGGLTYLRYKWDTSQNPDFPRNIGGKNAMGFGYRTVDKSIEIQGLVTPHSPLLW